VKRSIREKCVMCCSEVWPDHREFGVQGMSMQQEFMSLCDVLQWSVAWSSWVRRGRNVNATRVHVIERNLLYWTSKSDSLSLHNIV